MIARILFVVSAVAFGSVMVGCGHKPVSVKSTRGPDGNNDWKQITCKRMDKRCFSAARAMCPNGYVFTDGRPNETGSSNVKTLPPQEQWGDRMYSKKPGKLLVRCTDRPIEI